MKYSFSGHQVESLVDMISKFNSLSDEKYGAVKYCTLSNLSVNSLSDALDSQDDELISEEIAEEGFYDHIFDRVYSPNTITSRDKSLNEYFEFILEFGSDRNKEKLDGLNKQFTKFKDECEDTDECLGYDSEDEEFMDFITYLQATALEVFFYDMCSPAWFEGVAFYGLGEFLEKIWDEDTLYIYDLCESDLFSK